MSGVLKPWHIIVLVVVLLLLFGAKRLPDAARGLGRSLRILKAETADLREDDVDAKAERSATASRWSQRSRTTSRRRCMTRSTRSIESLTKQVSLDREFGEGRSRADFSAPADGSMTLIEHVRELRKRLLRACRGILIGAVARIPPGSADPGRHHRSVLRLRRRANGGHGCGFNTGSPLDQFMLNLKIALYAGLVIAAPVWLYQLWAFIAPGLHKRERRYGYAFAAVATPLFAAGFVLGFILVSRSMEWFLSINAELHRHGRPDRLLRLRHRRHVAVRSGFEFPMLVAMLNFAGLVSAKKLLSWWRIAIFLMFLFAAWSRRRRIRST